MVQCLKQCSGIDNFLSTRKALERLSVMLSTVAEVHGPIVGKMAREQAAELLIGLSTRVLCCFKTARGREKVQTIDSRQFRR